MWLGSGMVMLRDIGGLLALTARLLARFWPQLLLIGALGYIARVLILEAAVGVGLKAPLGGMVTLSLAVLVKLLVVIAMFATLRPGLPALAALGSQTPALAVTERKERLPNGLLAIAAAAILPFFAYYAAWGFLGDTVREYSRLALDRAPFGERIQIFELLRSRSLIAAIFACWLVRWLAKRASLRWPSPWLRLVIVAADASWIFIGLYALDKWKDDLISWIGAGAFLDTVEAGIAAFSTEAHAAAGGIAVEFQEPDFVTQAQNLFFYALLPLVWLVMAAIVYGYDLSARPAAAPPASRATTLRKWLADFAAHFLGDYRTRYRPVWTCLRTVLAAGLGTLLAFVVLYRITTWLTAWAWYGATRYLGPHDLETWQRIGDILVVLFGSPTELDGGILLDPVRIALLAAMLEYAVSRSGDRLETARNSAKTT
ncbi:hypothetical protein GOL30_20635 [Sinorhizobium medicae]|nr:hypothetical protein [Sinorhizobium medicae]MDX0990948.1 hypothetical protein [Sinorhizobium medicae]MDX1077132.1 hypothetical protein [Sinorhizobium medicae]